MPDLAKRFVIEKSLEELGELANGLFKKEPQDILAILLLIAKEVK